MSPIKSSVAEKERRILEIVPERRTPLTAQAALLRPAPPAAGPHPAKPSVLFVLGTRHLNTAEAE